MEVFFKKIIFNLVGLKNYLKIIHTFFYIYYENGFLKNNPIYKYHYFIKKLVHKGDVVIDIGANLGYYSKNLSNLVGENGHVFSVEPVLPFFEILEWALKKRTNVTLYNYALGSEVKNIELVLPKYGGLFRSGLAHIPQLNENLMDSYVFNAKMTTPNILFSKIDKIDYIKCDIEGYEVVVMAEMMDIFRKHRPLLQIETGGDNKREIDLLMIPEDYQEFNLINNELVKIDSNQCVEGDILYIPTEKIPAIFSKINAT